MKTNKTTTSVVTPFELQVLNFCKTAAPTIVRIYQDEYVEPSESLDEIFKGFAAFGTTVEFAQKPICTGFEGETRPTSIVLRFSRAGEQNVHVKIFCDLSSYGGLEYCNHRIVKPITKTVEVFE